jgi:hypothetical protein
MLPIPIHKKPCHFRADPDFESVFDHEIHANEMFRAHPDLRVSPITIKAKQDET